MNIKHLAYVMAVVTLLLLGHKVMAEKSPTTLWFLNLYHPHGEITLITWSYDACKAGQQLYRQQYPHARVECSISPNLGADNIKGRR